MLRPRLRRTACLLAALWLTIGVAQADQIEDEARKLMAAGNPSGALELLLKHEPERSGTPAFDFLLGLAAIDGGDPQRAVFALERVLALQPHNTLARAEIARAYYQLGERENAEREFRAVRDATDVPAPARANIERFLSVLAPSRTKLQAHLEASIGHDSNVNSASSLNEVAIPGFGGPRPLDAASLRRSDAYGGLGAGVSFSHDVTEEVAVIGSLTGAGKFNRHEQAFDTANIDGLLGLRQTIGPDAFTIAAQGQTFRLDDARFRDSGGFLVQWQRTLDRVSQVSLFYQQAHLHYPSQPFRDANRSIAGLAYGRAVPAWSSLVVFTSVYGGHEEARNRGGGDDPNDTGYPQLGHRPVGLRIGGEISAGALGRAFVVTSFERRRYDAPDPIFAVTRVDRQSDIRAGLRYPLAPRWTLTPEFAQTRNRSSIDLNAYTRTLWTLTIRHEF